MAIDFICGWECRLPVAGASTTPDELHWDSIIGVPAITTTNQRSGGAALHCSSAGAAVYMVKTIARTIVAGRFYVRLDSLPGANGIFFRLANASGNYDIQTSSAGVITCAVGTGANSAAAATLTTGGYHRVDFLADSSGATGSLKLRVDGGAEVTATNVQASANFTAARCGENSAVTMDVYVDDLLLGDATGDYPFGAGVIQGMKPTGDGTHSFTANDFLYNAAGAAILTTATDVYTYVDEDDMTSIADFINQQTIRTTGYVEVTFGSAPANLDAQGINVVSAWHAASTSANTVGLKLNDNGTLKTLTDEAGDGLSDFSQTTLCYAEKVLLVAPSTSLAWTATRLANMRLRMGYSDDALPDAYWDSVVVEVAYATAPSFVIPHRHRSLIVR